jgi:hypothetical protein
VKKVGEGMSVEPSYRVVVADIGARQGETTLESLRGGGDRSQSHGTRRQQNRWGCTLISLIR